MNTRLRFDLPLLLSFLAFGLPQAWSGPVISEFLAINNTGLVDGNGDASDWIEMHHSDGALLDLSQHYLTDDPENLTRWQFPNDTSLASGDHLIVFASGNSSPPPGELHASFKLSGGGEFLALVAPDGQTIIHSFALAYPQQFEDTSFGIAADGQAKYFPAPTPGAPNVGGISDPQAQVQYDPPAGTIAAATRVELTAANPAAAIRYTLDGSDPDETSALYTGLLAVTGTTEIRARLYVPGEEAGPINSASYVRLGNDASAFTSPLPIVVIENFGSGVIPDKRAHNPPAGDGGGIRQVPRQPAFLAIFDRGPDGLARLTDVPTSSTRMGIRVRGSSSANQPAKKENYSIEAWSAHDEEQVDITPLGLPPDNDFILYAPYNYDRALIRNAWVFENMRLMGHYASRTRFVEVFVNTEGDPLSMADFAGVFVLMEKIKQSNDRVDIDDLSPDGLSGGWLLESNRKDPLPEDGSNTQPFNFHTAGPNRFKEGPYGGSGGADRGGDDIPTGYNTFLNFVEPTGYKSNRPQRERIIRWFDTFEDALYGPDYRRPDVGFRKYLDIPSFIDHWIMVNLTRSVDGLQLSTFMSRPSTYGKLHLNPPWDYDRSIESYDGRDDAATGMWAQQFLWYPRLFSDPEFNQQAVDRWQELRRGVLSTASIYERIDAMAAEITEPVAAANFARWPSNNTPRSGGWPAEINHMKTWLRSRAHWIDNQYLSQPEFAPAGGSFDDSVTVRLDADDSGSIYYTLDGSDPRLPDFPSYDLELISESAPARGFIPTPANGGPQLADAWKGGQEPFHDSGWLSGLGGIGFGYPGVPGIDSSAMLDVTGSCYLRIPFHVEADTLASLTSLTLNMKYEDGFVAWINGVEVASMNRPGTLTWNATATDTHDELSAVEFVPFDVSVVGFLQPGENILALQIMNAEIDNSDVLAIPQLLGRTSSSGSPSSSARSYTGPIQLDSATTITARLWNNGSWSGPITTSYLIDTVPAGPTNLAVSEVMYRPPDASPSEELAGYSDRDEFEFCEIMNISATDTIDLTGLSFVQVDLEGDMQGIDFIFAAEGPVTFLRPGERAVLVENSEAFRHRYGPGPRIAGQYRNALSNDGERITILDASGDPIRVFTYNDQLPWHPAADGVGYSLVLSNPFSNPEHDSALNWIPSSAPNGTPGTGDSVQFTGEPTTDDDRDGLSYLIEYALGSSDSDPGSGPRSIETTVRDGTVVFSHTRNLHAHNIDLTVESSGDLQSWNEDSSDSLLNLRDRIHNNDGTETLVWSLSAESDSLFLRLSVTVLP